MKFLLDNEGKIWTRSYSRNGSKTDEQLRYGTPEESTHIIGGRNYRVHVSYHDPLAPDEEVEAEYDALTDPIIAIAQ
jgi:hypothetical protein